MLPHLAGDMGQNLMTVRELDLEHGVRKGLDDGRLDLDRIFFLGQTYYLLRPLLVSLSRPVRLKGARPLGSVPEDLQNALKHHLDGTIAIEGVELGAVFVIADQRGRQLVIHP